MLRIYWGKIDRANITQIEQFTYEILSEKISVG